jgi:hypothetical protein
VAAGTYPVIVFEQGVRIQDLPGAALLAPTAPVTQVELTLTPARIKGSANGVTILDWTTMVYRNSMDGEVHTFGPTLRVAAGDGMAITVRNNLTNPPTPAPNQLPASIALFHQPFYTTMHTHGLHTSPGILAQTRNPSYTSGDNIFVTLAARESNSTRDLPSLPFVGALPEDHMPVRAAQLSPHVG